MINIYLFTTVIESLLLLIYVFNDYEKALNPVTSIPVINK